MVLLGLVFCGFFVLDCTVLFVCYLGVLFVCLWCLCICLRCGLFVLGWVVMEDCWWGLARSRFWFFD